MRPIRPTSMWLTVNRGCNFRCEWCYAAATGFTSRLNMSLDFAKTLTNIAYDAGVRTVLLIGGEPTLWPHLPEFNDFCRGKGIRTILVTNGARFSNDAFCERYGASPCDEVGISVKGVTPDQLKQVTGVERFDWARGGIVRAIRDFGGHVNITYSNFAAGRLPEMVQAVTDWGSPSVKVEFCSTTFADGKPSSEHMVPPTELIRDIVDSFPELEGITGGNVILDMMVPLCIWPEDFIRELDSKGRMLSVCHVHKRRGLIVDGDGKIIMCNALFDYPLGHFGTDFTDGESLLAWLNSEKVLSFYDRIGSYPSVACKECSWYSKCAGGCPLRWASYMPDNLVQPKHAPLPGRRISHG